MTAARNHPQHDTLVLGEPVSPGREAPAGSFGSAMPASWSTAPGWGTGGWPAVPPQGAVGGTPVVVIARNNAAVVGATLGSVSLFLALLPLVGIVAWLLAPLGLISSSIGLVVGVSRRVGRVGALWGLITSGLALVVCALWVALVLAL